ncbi:MAG: MurR/RpiR family transcriptional regulator [Hungatella sp.]|nr:MurR/RpiR family transcriptional regulator [Hungatella sp.]
MLVKEKLQEREHFSDIDIRIADYVLERQESLKEDSVRQIARQLYVAPSTVIRFCQKLGYEGFNELREEYLNELLYLSSHFQSLDPNFPFDRQDRDMTVANKIGVLYEEIVRDCQSLLVPETLSRVVDMLRKAPAVYVCASGAQLGVAEVFRDKMMKIGKLVHICAQTDEGFYHASYCEPGSLFFLISYTGETTRVLRVAEKVRERHLMSVAVTSYGSNTLSSMCTCGLYVSTREKLINNLGSFGINVSVMYLLDVVYAGYFNRDYGRHLADKIRYSSESENVGREDGRHSDNPILKDGPVLRG